MQRQTKNQKRISDLEIEVARLRVELQTSQDYRVRIEADLDEKKSEIEALHKQNKVLADDNASEREIQDSNRVEIVRQMVRLQDSNSAISSELVSVTREMTRHMNVAVASTFLFLTGLDNLAPAEKYSVFEEACQTLGISFNDLGDVPKTVFSSATTHLLDHVHGNLIQSKIHAKSAKQNPSRERALQGLNELLDHIVQIVKAG